MKKEFYLDVTEELKKDIADGFEIAKRVALVCYMFRGQKGKKRKKK
jgi:hypothetical protein